MKLLLVVFIMMGSVVGLMLADGGPSTTSDVKFLIWGHIIMLALWGIGLAATAKDKKFLGADRYLILLLPVLAYGLPAAVTFIYLKHFA